MLLSWGRASRSPSLCPQGRWQVTRGYPLCCPLAGSPLLHLQDLPGRAERLGAGWGSRPLHLRSAAGVQEFSVLFSWKGLRVLWSHRVEASGSVHRAQLTYSALGVSGTRRSHRGAVARGTALGDLGEGRGRPGLEDAEQVSRPSGQVRMEARRPLRCFQRSRHCDSSARCSQLPKASLSLPSAPVLPLRPSLAWSP